MLVLGIETSCDETSAAVVRDGRDILSNAIWSQVKLHSPYGGVVPELASRAHIRNISTVVEMALHRAGVALDAVDAIAATQGPGLVGSLLVGLEFAKAMAFARGKPLVPVHHIAAHLYSPFLRQAPAVHTVCTIDSSGKNELTCAAPEETKQPKPAPAPRPRYPYLGLAISGGHSSLIRVEGPGDYKTLGETRDDAVGEAYDKVAKLLELGYPGGPILDHLAAEGNPRAIRFPRPLAKQKTLDFSFSGLKTAVLHYVQNAGLENIHSDPRRLRDLAASFQAAVIDTLLEKVQLALERERLDSLAVVGGVACNRGLRAALRAMQKARRSGDGGLGRWRRLWIPPPILCTDNAAMVAGLGYHLVKRRSEHGVDLTLNADPGLPLEQC
jgi:N6-L-threonylcarbamoyladenine synthase